MYCVLKAANSLLAFFFHKLIVNSRVKEKEEYHKHLRDQRFSEDSGYPVS